MSTEENGEVVVMSSHMRIDTGIRYKVLDPKHTGKRKRAVESRNTLSYSHRLDKSVRLSRHIDRANDLYVEEVTDRESGEIIHYRKEKLSEHKGHGSAKK